MGVLYRLPVVVLIAAALLSSCSKISPTAPTANCTFTISSTTVSVEASGGAMSVNVTTGNACVWTSLTNASFITMTSAPGQTGNGTATFTVAQNTGAARSGTFTIGGQTITVNQSGAVIVSPPPPTSADAIFGNWSGTITINAGCVAGLPLTIAWTGVIRQGGFTGAEFVISIPIVSVTSEAFPVTLNGSGLSFSARLDSIYVFTGTIAADRRSVNGTFAGANCAAPPTVINPSGTWTGIHQ